MPEFANCPGCNKTNIIRHGAIYCSCGKNSGALNLPRVQDPQPLTPDKKIAAARYNLDEADRRLTRARLEVEEALLERNEAHARYLSVVEWNTNRIN